MLKLKRYKEGVCIDYPEALGVRFRIRPITFSQTLGFLSETKQKKVVMDFPIDPKDLTKKGPQVVDDYKDGELLWKSFDQALEAWEGIDNVPEGEETPLSPTEVKHILFDNEKVRDFVLEKARDLAKSELVKQEQEVKN